MKIFSKEPAKAPCARAGMVSGFFLFSLSLGLLIGLFEAYLLWTRPRIVPLLVPDVGYVIWFLAPLVDMIFFGLVGLGLGLLSRRAQGLEALVAIEAAVAGTFLTFMLVWFHIDIGLHPFNSDTEIAMPLMVFAGYFIVFLALFAAVWGRVAALAERWMSGLARPLGRGLSVITTLELAGIVAFALWPPISGPEAPPTVPPPSGAPNIVFITLDTVRADHLSSYGYSRPTTPNLDRFARTGALFENAIAATSWTLPSHSSMFTGLLPQQHGADWPAPLASSPWTLAEILRSQGYETVGFAANPYYLQKGWGIAQGFETYEDYSLSLGNNLAKTLIGSAIVQPIFQNLFSFERFYRWDAHEVNGKVFRWFQQRPRRPFFLFINYFDAHDPYVTTAPYKGRFGQAPASLIRKLRFVAENAEPASAIKPERRKLLADSYDDCLAYLDDQVGELLHFFGETPEWQNTIVIITADHGEEFGSHGDYIHGFDLYRQLLHVPLIIAGPGVPKDVRITHLAATRQLFSTVLDLAGGGKTPFSRTSLARFWNPAYRPMPFDDAVVSELSRYTNRGRQKGMICVTTARYQYVEHRDGRQELYDWTVDPKEQANLATSPKEQSTLAGMHSRVVKLVSHATGPWLGPQYLQALDSVSGPARLSLLYPQPLRPGDPQDQFRIGVTQAHFEGDAAAAARPVNSERELLMSLPYQ